MTQITTGIRSILSQPAVYDLFQNIMGARTGRKEFASVYVQPFSGARILDIGCGTARILDHLPLDTKYFGFDFSQQYIEAAGKRYIARDAVFSCSLVDQVKVQSMPCFDIVIASGLLHHLGDNQAMELVSLAYQSLCDGGRFVSKDPCFDKQQSAFAHYMVSQDRGENVRDESGYTGLARTCFSKVTGTVKQQTWIPYTHFNMQCTK